MRVTYISTSPLAAPATHSTSLWSRMIGVRIVFIPVVIVVVLVVVVVAPSLPPISDNLKTKTPSIQVRSIAPIHGMLRIVGSIVCDQREGVATVRAYADARYRTVTSKHVQQFTWLNRRWQILDRQSCRTIA